jgi:dTDP-4-dehydrorhamnose reductase
MIRILLLGANGRLGNELRVALPALGSVLALGREECDLRNNDQLRELLCKVKPTWIVNAAAYTLVDKAESESELAFAVNSRAVKTIADTAREIDSGLVHYSADYVFDGCSPAPYTEDDEPNPINTYGRSKLAGEYAIRDSGCKHLVVRTSWIYSNRGKNFIRSILNLARISDRVEVVADQIGAPTSASLVARTTVGAISSFESGSLPAGTYHLSAGGDVDRHALAQYIVQKATDSGLELALTAKNVVATTQDHYAAPARRPKNSRLDSRLLATSLKFTIPHWKTGVDDVLAQMLPCAHVG